MYGPGDYEVFPKTDHPLDPRNDSQEVDDGLTTPEFLASKIYDECCNAEEPVAWWRIEDLTQATNAELFATVMNATNEKALAARFILMNRLTNTLEAK